MNQRCKPRHPSGAKARILFALGGTAEAVPFPHPVCEMASRSQEHAKAFDIFETCR